MKSKHLRGFIGAEPTTSAHPRNAFQPVEFPLQSGPDPVHGVGFPSSKAPLPALSLTSLRLRDFRCFPALNCALEGGITLFTGDNAQGKTSILEAV
ncbi:MAG: replication and repair protein RecF, partial [Verrucomicrobiales bacterium]|nr:replication and repair protein RecF [Verrucomicrobiales bacterium]